MSGYNLQHGIVPAVPVESQSRAAAAAMQRQDAWPYPWVYMPQDGRPFSRRGVVQAPAYGAGNQVIVTGVQYEVPQGYMGILLHLFWRYQGTGFVQGSGTIVTTVDINTPLGVAAASGYGVPDYTAMTMAIGDEVRPWALDGGWFLNEGDVVRMKTYTTGTVTIGAGNVVLGAVQGWIWPVQRGR